jgi:hypothetical protein
MPILDQMPDIAPLLEASGSLQGNLGSLTSTLGALAPDQAASPLHEVGSIFSTLPVRLDIDTGSLTGGLTGTLQSIQNALPANVLAYVESIDEAYAGLSGLLTDSALVRQVSAGASLQETAEAVIEDALGLFDTHVSELTGNLIDLEMLNALRGALTDITNFQDNFAAHQADFAPFLARQLAGVAPDFLDAPVAHVNSALAVLAPLDDSALAGTLTPARRAAASAYRDLLDAITNLNPADAAGYATIQVRLNALSAANDLLVPALTTLYHQVDGLIASQPWDTFFTAYIDLLRALTIPQVPTLGDVVGLLQQFLDDLLARFLMIFNAEDLRERIELLRRSLHDAIVGSPLGQVRQGLQGFLEQIRQAIEAVPTEVIQEAVDSMFQRANEALASLHLTELQDELTQAFASAEAYINEQLNSVLVNDVQAAMEALAGQLNSLPIAGLINDLSNALAQLQKVVANLEAAVQSQLDGLKGLLAQLDTLSYKPVSDEVIGEINQLKTRLAAINPNSLSDVEKLALQGALAILQQIDLEGQVVSGLRTGYHAAEREVKSLLDQITAVLNRLRDQFGAFDPSAILKPVNDVLDMLSTQVERLNGRALLSPLYGDLDSLEVTVQALQPGRLLDPLQAPFDVLTQTLNRLDPTAWVAPLNTLYEEIDRLISLVDITPLLDSLDQRQRALLDSVRQAILSAFDSLHLPEPLDAFFAQLRPVVDLITDALFGDPESGMKQVSLGLGEHIRLTSLFEPMDALYLRLLGMLESVPAADLTSVVNALRQSLGIGLEVLNPSTILDQLRAGVGQLQALAPATMLAQTVSLPALRASFDARVATAPAERAADVAAVSARFDVVFGVVAPSVPNSQLKQLTDLHTQLIATLQSRINGLDYRTASQRYAELRTNLERLLPDFLRQPNALSYEDILAGLYALRPSTRAAELEVSLSRFMKALEPVAATIEPAVNGFFSVLRDVASLISPLAVKESVAAIYDTIRAKVRVLDPAQLARSISELFEPVKAALRALNPATIKAQLNESFNRIVHAVTVSIKQILDQLVAVLDVQLRAIRTAAQALIGQVKTAITAALQSVEHVIKALEDLVFVEVLGRLSRVIDNLGASFDRELDRVRAAFDAMLAAIPLGSGGAAASASASVG